MLLVDKDQSQKSGSPISSDSPDETQQEGPNSDSIPEMLIEIMQNVGVALGISPQKFTKEQLEADPDTVKRSKKK
jgi:hypothetical protein